ncbi:hypothetical protein CEXT_705401 [Caerostris extrusa]|uniref:Uncharacterized protein n=1 Tax=Caerostris extrusa TaxID=172846 RepID=A0AAV4TS25_CAEEX|nr:hypothetical protein CEXT_705401 [Caerostris extrusa]
MFTNGLRVTSAVAHHALPGIHPHSHYRIWIINFDLKEKCVSFISLQPENFLELLLLRRLIREELTKILNKMDVHWKCGFTSATISLSIDWCYTEYLSTSGFRAVGLEPLYYTKGIHLNSSRRMTKMMLFECSIDTVYKWENRSSERPLNLDSERQMTYGSQFYGDNIIRSLLMTEIRSS